VGRAHHVDVFRKWYHWIRRPSLQRDQVCLTDQDDRTQRAASSAFLHSSSSSSLPMVASPIRYGSCEHLDSTFLGWSIICRASSSCDIWVGTIHLPHVRAIAVLCKIYHNTADRMLKTNHLLRSQRMLCTIIKRWHLDIIRPLFRPEDEADTSNDSDFDNEVRQKLQNLRKRLYRSALSIPGGLRRS